MKKELNSICSSTNTIKQVVLASIPIIIFVLGLMITLSTAFINSKFDTITQKMDYQSSQNKEE